MNIIHKILIYEVYKERQAYVYIFRIDTNTRKCTLFQWYKDLKNSKQDM